MITKDQKVAPGEVVHTILKRGSKNVTLGAYSAIALHGSKQIVSIFSRRVDYSRINAGRQDDEQKRFMSRQIMKAYCRIIASFNRIGERKLFDKKIGITYLYDVYTNVRYAGNMNNIKLKG